MKTNKSTYSESFYFPNVNNRTYGISLYKKATRLNPELVYQYFNEQRRYPRFKPDTQIFIHHAAHGTVDDISIGGLSYTYLHFPKETAGFLPGVSTLISADKNHLCELPCTVVTDTVIRKAYSSFPELKQRRLAFNQLTGQQIQKLEQFILTHTVVPMLEAEEEHPPSSLQGSM